MTTTTDWTVRQGATLVGHRGQVLCLDYRHGSLLSGSEDGTVRVWDDRTLSLSGGGRRGHATRCLVTPGREAVNSVAYHPTASTSLCLACGNRVYGYDLRGGSSEAVVVVMNANNDDSAVLLEATDEVNQVCLEDESGGRLAAADDSGHVRIFDGSLSGGAKVLAHACAHEDDQEESSSANDALVTCVAWTGGGRLVSGGTDCTVSLWDADDDDDDDDDDPKPIFSHTFGIGDSPQICNPPMVHSLSYNRGRLASGLGDGTCQIFTVYEGDDNDDDDDDDEEENGKYDQTNLLQPEKCLTHGESAVASVHFSSKEQLLTAGVDGNIHIWNVFTGSRSATVEHGEKLNWITSAQSSPGTRGRVLFVADTSNDISTYLI